MRGVGLRVLLVSIVCAAGCRPAPAPVGLSPPKRITAEWVLRAFPNCIDPCAGLANRPPWDSLRCRSDFLRALTTIAEDASLGPSPRINALQLLGATGQPGAYAYLVRRLGEPDWDEALRLPAIGALAPYAPGRPAPPASVRARLGELACTGSYEVRRAALEVWRALPPTEASGSAPDCSALPPRAPDA